VSFAVAFLWAVAEATIWPIMPDAVLVPLVLARPAAWWRLVVAAALGTAVGGSLSYALGRSQPGRAAVERLPLVRPAMVEAVDRWLTREGARGVWRQPATGVPFKVFARLAGARGLPPGQFLVWAVAARSARFIAVAGVVAMVGRRWPDTVGRWFWWLTLLWGIVFGAALWRLVRYWERRGEAPVGNAGSA
jgi:membrane protein YqaA with SNARE-associated domain